MVFFFWTLLLSDFIKFCSGKPDPPIKVELCDWDVDHMDLQWGFPPSDGGAPILKYEVTVKTFLFEGQMFSGSMMFT